MTFYGEPSQPLFDLLKAHQVGLKWFSFEDVAIISDDHVFDDFGVQRIW